MKVVIVGITGRLGKRIARELVTRGRDVLGVNRRPERVPVVLGDLLGNPKLETRAGDTADCACAILDEARDHRYSRTFVSIGC